MKYELLMDLIESATSMEEIKVNLMLSAIDYRVKPFGRGEMLEAKVGESSYRILKDGDMIVVEKGGKICRNSQLAAK